MNIFWPSTNGGNTHRNLWPGARHEKGVESTKEQRSFYRFPPAISSIGIATTSSTRSRPRFYHPLKRFSGQTSGARGLWVLESSLKFRGGGRNSKGGGWRCGHGVDGLAYHGQSRSKTRSVPSEGSSTSPLHLDLRL